MILFPMYGDLYATDINHGLDAIRRLSTLWIYQFVHKKFCSPTNRKPTRIWTFSNGTLATKQLLS